VRGGIGFFDVLPLLYTTITLNGRAAPFFQIVSTNDTAVLKGKFPSQGQAAILNNSANPPTLEYGSIESQPKRDYVMQWNFNIQREVARDLTVVLGYVGSLGYTNCSASTIAILSCLRRPPRATCGLADQMGKAIPLRHGLPADRHAGQSHNKRCGQPRRRSDPACGLGGSSSYQALQVGVVKKNQPWRATPGFFYLGQEH